LHAITAAVSWICRKCERLLGDAIGSAIEDVERAGFAISRIEIEE
jgi:hypothetical protein